MTARLIQGVTVAKAPEAILKDPQNLRVLMAARGETTRSLAAKAGVSPSFIGQLMVCGGTYSRNGCTWAVAHRIAEGLGVDLGLLFHVPPSSDTGRSVNPEGSP